MIFDIEPFDALRSRIVVIGRLADVVGLIRSAYRMLVAQCFSAVEPLEAVLVGPLAVRELSFPAMARKKRHRLQFLDRLSERKRRNHEQNS